MSTMHEQICLLLCTSYLNLLVYWSMHWRRTSYEEILRSLAVLTGFYEEQPDDYQSCSGSKRPSETWWTRVSTHNGTGPFRKANSWPYTHSDHRLWPQIERLRARIEDWAQVPRSHTEYLLENIAQILENSEPWSHSAWIAASSDACAMYRPIRAVNALDSGQANPHICRRRQGQR